MTLASSPVDILSWQRTVAALNILTAAEQAVADALSRRINSASGVCFPSLKTLAADVGLSVSVAKRTVRKLARAGLLAIRRTGRGSIYRLLRWVGADPSDRPAATPKRAKSKYEVLPPSPREREPIEIEPGIATEQPPAPAETLPLPIAHLAVESAAECQPEGKAPEPLLIKARSAHLTKSRQQSASIDPEPAPQAALVEPQTAPAPAPAPTTPLLAENPVQRQPEPDVTVEDVVQIAILAHFRQITGIDCDRPRHRKAIAKALQANTQDEITRAASYCASNWSNRAWATPTAVLKDGRVDEVLSQAKATTIPSAAAHRPFNSPRLRLPQEYVEQHRQDGEDLAGADARLLFEIRTGKRRMPKAEIAA